MPDAQDPSVTSEPLDTEDGGTVVIRQQNVGADNQVGGGEFKDAERAKSPEEAGAEQEALEQRAPTPGDGEQGMREADVANGENPDV